MTLRTSRRRVAQTALVTAAVATLPRSRAAAQQATPVPGEAAITAAQVDAALDRLDSLIADGMTQTGVPGTVGRCQSHWRGSTTRRRARWAEAP
jgi:hypothetical protein